MYCYTLKSRDNITYYFDGGGWAWELEGTEEDYTLTHGCLTVTKGNTLKIIPTQCKTENGVIATWEAMNPDIATVTEDGEIIGLKEGAAMFMVYDARGGQSIIQVYVSERERIPEYQDRPIDQEHPTPVPEPITPPSSQPTDAPVPTFAPEIVEQVEGFTGRMYEIALGRDAENQGINDWTNRLLSHEVDGAGIAQGFIMSEEFTGKELSDEEYVETLYQTFFDRPADEEGKNTWLGILAEGKTRESVLAGFVNSGEFDTLCDSFGIVRGIMREDGTTVNPGIRLFTERLYNKVLDREGEKAGLEDWTGWIAFGDYSAEDAAKLFFDSDEFIDRGLSDADYVETLYQTFMGRDSDPDGRSFWLEQLAGGMSRTEVLEGFSRSTEFGNILQSFGL